MAFRVSPILLLLTTAMVAAAAMTEVAIAGSDQWGLSAHTSMNMHASCDSSVGQRNVEPEEEEEMTSSMSDLEQAARRKLYGQGNYISYGALRRDSVPCNRRGDSYYSCRRSSGANPYRRGCSVITHCARDLQ